MITPFSRRGFVIGSAGGLLAALAPRSGFAQDAKPTPDNILGPYYKAGAPKTAQLAKDGDAGLPLVIDGRVSGAGGAALANASVEVWHADPEGEYDNAGFHLRATVPVDKDGRYHFETVLPGHYGIGGYGPKEDQMRPQHIHYRVTAPGHRDLVTQLYFESDPFFDGNPAKTLKKDPFVKHRELVVPVLIHRKVKAYSTSAAFDVVLAKA